MLKITEVVSRDYVNIAKPSDLLRIKIDRKNQWVKISSRYLDRYEVAVSMLHELLVNLYEEFKRFCEKSDWTPPHLLVKRIEDIQGFRKEFKVRSTTTGHVFSNKFKA